MSLNVVGGLLPPDLLGRINEGADIPGLRPADYHLAVGETVRQAASRSWEYLTGVWKAFRDELDRLPAGGPTTSVTRERWLLILFRELGFGRLQVTPSGGLVVGGRGFPVSHRWEHVPMHLLGWGTSLDHRTRGMAGAAGAAPQSMMQELLNRADEHLWAALSNGQRLRLLRDSTSLVGSSYVEFDLEAMFDGVQYSDFVLLYLLCHQSRFEAGENGPADCWLEKWRDVAADQGMRALERLREGVEEAMGVLGTGFLQHRDNRALRERLASGDSRLEVYHRSLLRTVYQLLFWFVAEDRDALLPRTVDAVASDRYTRFYSSARLRELARTRRGDRHDDLWRAVRVVFDGLSREGGRPELGLPALGGLYELDGEAGISPSDAALPNEALLSAVRALSVVRDKAGGPRRTVDFRNLGAEELGSVYESLLELHPRHDPSENTFSLDTAAGNDRKTTGSYYTPPALVDSLLDTALDPVLAEADTPSDVLEVTVCDPACGSGHFLVAAARRIAKRLAYLESGEPEPPPEVVRAAMRRVVGRCVYGVDVNPLAAELAKVSLWMEALEPGRPLSFLDANIRVGNSLLGVTPALLDGGVPDDALKAIEGDEKSIASLLVKRNKAERRGERDLFTGIDLGLDNAALARATAELTAETPGSLSDVHSQERRYRAIEADRLRERSPADAWCASFVQNKIRETEHLAITQATVERLREEPDRVDDRVRRRIAKLYREYRFFHWHLEFPHIFRTGDGVEVNPETGWDGGFSCVLGNPPWDRVKLQEQEFFASRDEDIAKAPNAAARKRRIAALENSEDEADRTLHEDFLAARRRAEGVSHFLRVSGRYPLAGRGDINTYQVFAEDDRTIIAPKGRLGVIVPTGIATDATTQYFFRDLVESSSLASLYDFENRKPLFHGVDSRYKFSLLTLTGSAIREAAADFAFFLHDPAELSRDDVVFALKPEEITLLNPNTGTCPVFRSRRDAEITLDIYRRVPVLIREGDPDGNPWGVSFMTMFHMSNDSHLFRTREQLEADGWHLDGNVFVRGTDRMLPLYEAKMLHHYDHRWATYEPDGSTRDVTVEEKQDPHFTVLPRYWVADKEIDERLADRWDRNWLLGYRWVTNATNERTLICALTATTAAGNSEPLVFVDRAAWLLGAAWSSFPLDYVTRQKLGGQNMTFSTTQQLPVLPPSSYEVDTPWQPGIELRDWIADRVLELVYTSWDVAPLADDLGYEFEPFVWDEERRALLRAELDAAYFHLYGVEREDVDYILDTFPIVKRKDEQRYGEYRTKRLILEIYDAMAAAIATVTPYRTILDPPPGDGPRHKQAGRR